MVNWYPTSITCMERFNKKMPIQQWVLPFIHLPPLPVQWQSFITNMLHEFLASSQTHS